MDDALFDIAVIGGGVNGCGVARDAAGRGLKVVLFEQGDLASATSSASTKLIHGGLRYLEQYEFKLVREALKEREVLATIAPFLVHPIRFVLPHHKGLRPRWMLRLGLFLYDHLGGSKRFEKAKAVDLRQDPVGAPLKPQYRHAFAYTDCQTDDARLVTLNAMDARDRGADIRVRTRVTNVERGADGWTLSSQDEAGHTCQTRARVLVNASGPWVNATLGIAHQTPPSGVRLVQGSHITTRKLYDHDEAYIFQNGDGRIVFAIPYQDEFTLIGTTDRDWTAGPGPVEASAEEVEYLCAAVSEYFARPVTPDQVVWTYSGVRALVDNGSGKAQETTRDYVLSLDAPGGRRARAICLRRQDHHLPPPGGGGDGAAGSAPSDDDARRLDGNRAPARRRPRPRRRGRAHRRAPRRPPVADRRPRPATGALLWRARDADAGGGAGLERPRRSLRPRPHGARGGLPDGQGVGADGRRRALAPE